MRRKSENSSRTSALAATLVGLLFLSCSPSSPTDPSQTQGQVQVNVSTSGTGVPSSFTVTLNGGSSRSVSPDGSVTYGSLSAGNYTVALGVPGNCTISGPAEQSVGVQEGSTSTVAYSVSCSAVPTGAIGVTTSTTGSPVDPDGYTVSVDGGAARAIGVNDNLLIPDLGLGDHEVELSGVADNCLVQGANPRTVSVSENQTTTTEFEVVCSATTGRIDVTVTTTGEALDPDGYIVDLDGGAVTRQVDTNGSVAFTGVEQGGHTLRLDDVASNCTVVSDNPVSIEVIAGQTTDVSFTVECEATTGSLEVSATTTGDELDPNGYTVTVDGSLEQALAVNGSTTFTDLPPGEHTVELTGVASNCAVAGDNPRTVEIVAGETASTNFDVTCSATVGSIEVTVTTTGEAIDADGYSVVLDGGTSTQLVAPNDTIVFGGVAPGEHTLQLQNVAGNCTVTSPNPATADVVAGAQTDVAFTVECEQLTGSIQVNVATTGDELDPDGYTVTVDGASARSIGINDTETYLDVVIGDYSVEITGVASNCGVQDTNPRTVTVNEGATTQVDFDVVCSATAGQIEVTVSTTGDDLDPNGYTVDLDGTSSEAVATNGTTTFTGVSEGNHTLTLQNIATNCATTSPNPTSTNVTVGETSNVSFTVECVPLVGDLRVNVSTTGEDLDSDGYTVLLDGGSGQSVDINGSTTFIDVDTGSHSVELTGIASNCSVVGDNPKTVTVEFDITVDVDFDVTCEGLTGDLTVNTSTTGDELDPDGYTVTVDGGSARSIGINDTETYLGVADGVHSVELSGVASNCKVSGSNPRNVNVPAGGANSTTFDVTCEATTGSIDVTANTTGDEQDTSYTVSVDGGTAQTLQANADTLTFPDLAPGDHEVALGDVASNCTVTGGAIDTVSVTAGNTTLKVFDVTCETTTGSIEVTTTTTGTNLDPDGYTVDLDGVEQMTIQPNDTVTFTAVTEGVHTLTLTGEALNCTITSENPTDTTVTAGETATVGFAIECT